MKKILLITVLLGVLLQADELNFNECNTLTKQARILYDEGKKDEATHTINKLCNDGCGTACFTVEDNMGNGLGKAMERGCASKIPDGFSCYELSYSETDKRKQLQLKEKGCAAGYLRGCANLASDYAYAKDYENAIKYYKKSCELGDSQSCGTLGTAYATGKFKITNYKKSYQYLSKSIELDPKNTASKGNLEIVCKQNPWACK